MPALQENRDACSIFWQNYEFAYVKLVLRNISPLFYIKLEKVALFSCRSAFGVCIGTDFMCIACFVQKLSRFEVCMFLLPKVIVSTITFVIADHLPITFGSKNIQLQTSITFEQDKLCT